MDLFAPAAPTPDGDARAARSRVRGWAREHFALDAADAVSVSELACREPGCPPRETVLVVSRAGAATESHTIHLPVVDVRAADVARLAGAGSTDHHHDRAPGASEEP